MYLFTPTLIFYRHKLLSIEFGINWISGSLYLKVFGIILLSLTILEDLKIQEEKIEIEINKPSKKEVEKSIEREHLIFGTIVNIGKSKFVYFLLI